MAIRFTSDPAEEAAFFEQIGRCVSIWAEIEIALLLVLIFCMRPRNSQLAHAMFFTSQAFHSKLKIVDAAATSMLTGEILTEWQALRKKCKGCSETRNRIAHFQALQPWQLGEITLNAETREAIIPTRRQLGASLLSIAGGGSERPTYTTDQLREVFTEFKSLEIELYLFARKLHYANADSVSDDGK